MSDFRILYPGTADDENFVSQQMQVANVRIRGEDDPRKQEQIVADRKQQITRFVQFCDNQHRLAGRQHSHFRVNHHDVELQYVNNTGQPTVYVSPPVSDEERPEEPRDVVLEDYPFGFGLSFWASIRVIPFELDDDRGYATVSIDLTRQSGSARVTEPTVYYVGEPPENWIEIHEDIFEPDVEVERLTSDKPEVVALASGFATVKREVPGEEVPWWYDFSYHERTAYEVGYEEYEQKIPVVVVGVNVKLLNAQYKIEQGPESYDQDLVEAGGGDAWNQGGDAWGQGGDAWGQGGDAFNPGGDPWSENAETVDDSDDSGGDGGGDDGEDGPSEDEVASEAENVQKFNFNAAVGDGGEYLSWKYVMPIKETTWTDVSFDHSVDLIIDIFASYDENPDIPLWLCGTRLNFSASETGQATTDETQREVIYTKAGRLRTEEDPGDMNANPLILYPWGEFVPEPDERKLYSDETVTVSEGFKVTKHRYLMVSTMHMAPADLTQQRFDYVKPEIEPGAGIRATTKAPPTYTPPNGVPPQEFQVGYGGKQPYIIADFVGGDIPEEGLGGPEAERDFDSFEDGGGGGTDPGVKPRYTKASFTVELASLTGVMPSDGESPELQWTDESVYVSYPYDNVTWGHKW